MLDRIGAKRPVVIGCVLGAVGFFLWAGKVTDLNFGAQQWYIILAGAGMGFMLGPASTDAVNRASRLSYGEATGITQTVRNYAASLGLAILGTILVIADAHARHHLADRPRPAEQQGGRRGGEPVAVAGQRQRERRHRSRTSIRVDFAQSTQTVLYVMAAIMAAAADRGASRPARRGAAGHRGRGPGARTGVRRHRQPLTG